MGPEEIDGDHTAPTTSPSLKPLTGRYQLLIEIEHSRQRTANFLRATDRLCAQTKICHLLNQRS